MEAKDYPFYGVQFHPEKNLFEWKVYADRTANDIIQMLSNKFVEQARKSQNSFANDSEFFEKSIYRHDPRLD
jgi:gamma-glutamyl hydrolase